MKSEFIVFVFVLSLPLTDELQVCVSPSVTVPTNALIYFNVMKIFFALNIIDS